MLTERIGLLLGREKMVTAPPRATVLDAAHLMLENAVSAVVVVEDGLLTGILTEHDVVFRVVAAGRDPSTVGVEEVMTRQPVTIGPEEKVAGRRCAKRWRRCAKRLRAKG